ncbi:hypothetical protein [Halocatena halophila]|uniref:hypothetical protein n=1 Tax=Halocatena halophila TaxID=2814576 RepID=UPI002ED25E4A
MTYRPPYHGQGLAVIGVCLVVVLTGCLGGSFDGSQEGPPSATNTSNGGTEYTETMGPIPPMSEKTNAVMEELDEKHDRISSYEASITERTVTELSNGSTMEHVMNWHVQVKYTDDGVLTNVSRWSPDTAEKKSFHIRNRSAEITYLPDQNEYAIERYDRSRNTDRENPGYAHFRSYNGEYNIFDANPAELKRENAIEFAGNETVRGEKAYVIELDGNPNGGHKAYYAAQTFYVDTDTGVVLKQTAQKPHLDSMANITVDELEDPGDRSVRNDTDDPDDAVYLGDKTITTTYTNVSVNSVSDDAFTLDLTADDDVEVISDDEG